MAKDTERSMCVYIYKKIDMTGKLWLALLKRPNTGNFKPGIHLRLYYKSSSPVTKSESKLQRLTPGMEGLGAGILALVTMLVML